MLRTTLRSITAGQAQKGYATLCDLAAALKEALADTNAQAQRLLSLTNAFYNTIPHKFERRATPPVITSREMLVEKLDAIEALLNISQAQSMSAELGGTPGATFTTHPTDANYEMLKCGLVPVSAPP